MRTKYLLLRSKLRGPLRTEKPPASISGGKKAVSPCRMVRDSAEMAAPTFDHDGESM